MCVCVHGVGVHKNFTLFTTFSILSLLCCRRYQMDEKWILSCFPFIFYFPFFSLPVSFHPMSEVIFHADSNALVLPFVSRIKLNGTMAARSCVYSKKKLKKSAKYHFLRWYHCQEDRETFFKPFRTAWAHNFRFHALSSSLCFFYWTKFPLVARAFFCLPISFLSIWNLNLMMSFQLLRHFPILSSLFFSRGAG